MPQQFGPPSTPQPVYTSPGFGPPGTPPGATSTGGGGGGNKLPLILGAAALVVAILVVVIVLVVSGGDGGGGTGPTAGPTTESPVTTTTSSTTTTSQATTPAPEPEDDLRAIVPGGFDASGCTTQQAAGDGDLAALDCGAATAADGPTDSAFYLYPDAQTLDEVFLADVARVGLSELSGQNCPDAQGYQNYNGADGQPAGRIACYVREQDNASVLLWTQDEFSAEGFVVLANGGVEGLATLIDWWRVPSNSDFG
jgi:serine/threonine-protein kinase